MTSPAYPDWRHDIAVRFRSRWWLKALGIGVAISVFMCAYFALLRHPQFAVTVIPRTPPDHWIAFTPWAIVPYASLWLYIGIVPSLLQLRGEMAPYVVSALAVSVIGCGIFYFWPTVIAAAPIDWSPWPAVALLKSADATGNACPSLHVAFAVLTGIWLAWLLRRVGAPRWPHVINVVWCLLIVWSTVAIRQHVMLDVAAGAALGGVIALATLLVWQTIRRLPVGAAGDL